jgi:putative membrane protein
MKTTTRTIWIVVAVVIGLGLLAGGFLFSRTGWGMFGYGPGMIDGNFGFGMMTGFGGIAMILFWVVIIGLGVWLISSLVSRANSQPPSNSVTASESALDILKKRYARGEITKEQFDQMRRDLNA